MNQGRIWCVVHPTVGLPLLLGSVALTSLAVHTAVMTHTTWMSNYWMGAARVRVSDNAATSQNAFSMTVSPAPVAGGPAPAAFVITVAPAPGGTTALAASEPQTPKPGSVPIHTASAN